MKRNALTFGYAHKQSLFDQNTRSAELVFLTRRILNADLSWDTQQTWALLGISGFAAHTPIHRVIEKDTVCKFRCRFAECR